MNKILKVIEIPRLDSPEILKQNNLINCAFEELSSWSEIEHDLLNEIIALYQKNPGYEETLFSDEFKRKIFVRRKTIEKNIAIRRKSDNEIFELLKKIRDTSITIKNIYHSNGYKTTRSFAFLDKVFLHEKEGKESYFEIQYSEEFGMICDKTYSIRYGNYSRLYLPHLIKLKGKYSKYLYELLESNKYKKSFTISEKELKQYFKYNIKNYSFSYLVREIQRSFTPVSEKINFKYFINKSEKSISFHIT